MGEAMKNHAKIAVSIRDLVILPFATWAEKHKTRVTTTKEDIDAKIRDHAKHAELVNKLRTAYFNKGRLLEDYEEENKFAFQPQDTLQSPSPQTPTIVLPDTEDDELEPVEIGDIYYPPEKLKELLAHIINTLNLSEFKVAILGTYENTATGADFVDYFQKYMDATTISLAERIGQDLTDLGFLRLVGNVGSIFANSSKLHYQIRPRCFKLAGIPLPKKNLIRIASFGSNSDDTPDSSPVNTVSELFAGWNPLNSNGKPNETPPERLKREAQEADNKYRAAVLKLDLMRCNLEESMIDYFNFMERCELDRLKAIKAVILDFSGSIGNVVPSLRSTVDQMMAFQEAIQPAKDLSLLIESYKTGIFIPHVTPYESYNGLVDSEFTLLLRHDDPH